MMGKSERKQLRRLYKSIGISMRKDSRYNIANPSYAYHHLMHLEEISRRRRAWSEYISVKINQHLINNLILADNEIRRDINREVTGE